METTYTTLVVALYANCLFVYTSYAQNQTVRLVGGLGDFEGRVEVFYNDSWGTVCDNLWGFEEAEVVCQQLGFTGADLALVAGRYGPGEGDILLDMVQCNGTEETLFECRHAGINITKCSHAEDAGVVCTSRGSLRLVNGSVVSEGRVEVFDDSAGVWGTVCDDEWSLLDGRVACRQLGYPNVEYTFSTYGFHHFIDPLFGSGTGPILLDGLRCNGAETRLDRCLVSKGWGISDCTHREDAGLSCDAQVVRFVDEESDGEGRIEVYYGGTWGTICDHQWDMNDAHVVCRQFGFPHGAVAAITIGGGSGPILLDNVACIGNESSVLDCPTSGWAYSEGCNHTNDAGVICNEPSSATRLLSGSSSHEGVVEYTEGSTRGLICDSNWSDEDAMVVCRQLGYQQGVKSTAVTLGRLSGHIFYRDYRCNGDEAHLPNCEQSVSGLRSCNPGDIAQVYCSPPKELDIRLVGSEVTEQGRVEVFLNGEWGSMQDDSSFTFLDGYAMCHQLGYDGAKDTYEGNEYFGQGSGPIWIVDLRCSSDDFHLSDCDHIGLSGNTTAESTHADDISLVCYPYESVANHPIRLVSETGEINIRYGRLEIFHDGVWGTVCARGLFYRTDITIVCRELGYTDLTHTNQIRLEASGFPAATGQIWTEWEFCRFSFGQDKVYKCSSSGWGVTAGCDHSHDLGIACVTDYPRPPTTESPTMPTPDVPVSDSQELWMIPVVVLGISLPSFIILGCACCCSKKKRTTSAAGTTTAQYTRSTDTVEVEVVSTPPPEYVPPSPPPVEAPPTYDSVSGNAHDPVSMANGISASAVPPDGLTTQTPDGATPAAT